MSRGVLGLSGVVPIRGKRIQLEVSCAWVTCDHEGCRRVVTVADRIDTNDAVVLAIDEGWTCDEEGGDRCEAHKE